MATKKKQPVKKQLVTAIEHVIVRPDHLDVRHIDGAAGAVREDGLMMALFAEVLEFEKAVLRRTVNEETEEVGDSEVEYRSDNPSTRTIYREVQFVAHLNFDAMVRLRDWLNDRIQQHQELSGIDPEEKDDV